MKVITEDKFESTIKDNNIIIQLSADWCGPCRILTPVLSAVAAEKGIEAIKVNIDNNPKIVAKYAVKSIPRILFVKDGLVEEELVGNQNRAKLEAVCKEVYGV
jgi:thioredoxin 1|tara:strand:- start:4709 stop:5017 length:309 start_codon:yes stop_codon:yes gene_type:complete